MDTLARLREGLTILLSQQNAVAALGIAGLGYVLAAGRWRKGGLLKDGKET